MFIRGASSRSTGQLDLTDTRPKSAYGIRIDTPASLSRQRRVQPGDGLANLSLIEHALCPLDQRVEHQQGLSFETQYYYTDRHRNRRLAKVRILSAAGLTPSDEMLLWGLLAMTFGQAEVSSELYATPHYILKQLGQLDGGKQYETFREMLKRLSAVNYWSNGYYDPIRGEHREVSFGLLSFSLPIDPRSSRSWRIIWNPLFFEFVAAAGTTLQFDFDLYRSLDCGSRRLYLLLKKIFWRERQSPAFDIRHLAVDILGYAPHLELKTLKQKVLQCAERLLSQKLLTLPTGAHSVNDLCFKRSKGEWSLMFHRGPAYEASVSARSADLLTDSPFTEQLRQIGLEDRAITRVIRTYKPRMLGEWIDVTLAAQERQGPKFFKKGAAAFLIDNLKAAAQGLRTPPDWFRLLRKKEDEARFPDRHAAVSPELTEAAFKHYLEYEAREAFQTTVEQIFADLAKPGSGLDPHVARAQAERFTLTHFKNKFRAQGKA